MEGIKTISEKDLAPLMGVHSILSKREALTVFLKVAGGLKSNMETPESLGLTKKQYYTRLKSLVDLGLVQKSGDVYTLTSLGENVCQNQITGLASTLRDSKKHQMIDVLRKDSRFSAEEIKKVIDKMN